LQQLFSTFFTTGAGYSALVQINPDTVADYARQRGLIPASERPPVEPLSGGVACGVFRLHAARGPIVVKQAQERFRVQHDWRVDRRRNIVEAKFQQLARQALGAAHVPEVLDVDEANFAYTMASAPLNARNWKTMLLAGEVRPELGRQCRELLEKLHAMPVPEFLGDDTLFWQQRIEPYFEFIRPRYPAVRPVIEELCRRHERVTHGDYTPKNFLVAGGTLILLDYEVVHLGWPEFDVASIVNHLTLKMFHVPEHQPAFKATADHFLAGHAVHLPLLGALLLARVDGKSPAEYLRDEDKPRIRDAGRKLLGGQFASYDDLIKGVI
jgi:tRNA A-37 threonylcarbamoyl transferase component Bud32